MHNTVTTSSHAAMRSPLAILARSTGSTAASAPASCLVAGRTTVLRTPAAAKAVRMPSASTISIEPK